MKQENPYSSLFEQYRQTRDNDIKNAIIDLYLQRNPDELRITARKIYATLPNEARIAVDSADLESEGYFGIDFAVRNYDSDKSDFEKTHVKIRIRGAMLDALRNLDVVERNLRRRANHLERTTNQLAGELGHKPSFDELSLRLGKELYERVEERNKLINDANNHLTQSLGYKPNTLQLGKALGSIDRLRETITAIGLLKKTHSSLKSFFKREPTQDELVKRLGEDYLERLKIESPKGIDRVLFRATPQKFYYYEDDEDAEYQRYVDILPDSKAENPVERQEKAGLFKELTRGLSDKDKLLLIDYYYMGLRMKAIGVIQAQAESRISQRHSELRKRIAGNLANRGLGKEDLFPGKAFPGSSMAKKSRRHDIARHSRRAA
jgi:RNA polymerase sigma factor (sigma-70 family)